MTRPMPGPPDARHVFYSFPHTHPDDAFGLCPRCAIDDQAVRASGSKRLKDAECGAEYWRAEADHTALRNGEGVGWSSAAVTAALEHEVEVWHRFTTHPHAFKETPNDRP